MNKRIIVLLVMIVGVIQLHGQRKPPAEKPMSKDCLLYTSPSPRDRTRSRMPSSAWKKNKKK